MKISLKRARELNLPIPVDPVTNRKTPRKREGGFQEQVIELAKLQGWRVACFRCVRVQRPNGSIYFETPAGADGKGWPDLCLVRGVRLIFAELKAPGRCVTPEQALWLRDLSCVPSAECYVWHPCDFPKIMSILDRSEQQPLAFRSEQP